MIKRHLCVASMLAALFAGISQSAQADEVIAAGEPVVVARSVTLNIIPANSPQDAAVRAALQDALQANSPPRTLAEIKQRSTDLTTALRKGGFPVGLALMTQNDWQAAQQTGQMVFTVFPGRISDIEVQNASRVEADRLKQAIMQAMCGQALDAPDAAPCLFQSKNLERTTQLLQDMPGVALGGAPQVGPGSGTGDVKAIFSIVEKGEPYTFGLSMDNNGVETTGRVRATASLSANNYFGLGEDYAINLARSSGNMWTGSIGGGIPIASDGLRATAGFTRQQYTVSSGGLTFAGTSNTSMLGLAYPFTRGLDENLWGNLSYLHSNSKVDFRGFDFSTHSQMDALKASFSANNGDRARQLRTDQWSGELALTYGKQSNDDALDAAGPQRAGDYAKLTASGRVQLALNPTGDIFVTARGVGQYGNKNLDASEQLGVGGPYAVRAYRTDEPMLNDGVLLGLGLYSQFPVAVGHQILFGSFLDYAYGKVNHDPWAGWESSYPGIAVRNSRQLAGYGFELGWLTPFGATLSFSASRAFGFSDASWIEPGELPVQYWLSLSWGGR
jgi:hemolysin activation/secretion protein